MPKLRLVPYAIYSAAINMAADEYILSQEGTTLRFYGWEKPTLSFGRNAADVNDVDIDVCRKNNLELVKRLTGGKTVLHQHELTYGIVGDIEAFSESILQTYRMISEPLSESLLNIGVDTSLAPRKQRDKRSSICFEEVSAYEIEVEGRKLVGSAQYRRNKRFLQHGSILADLDWKLWKKVWQLPENSKILENRITTISQEIGEVPDLLLLATRFAENLANTLNLELKTEQFSQVEMEQIVDLSRKYQWE